VTPVVRWAVKKVARHAVALGGALTRRVGARPAELRVLTYHRFDGEPQNPFSMRAEAFETQMAWLARERRAVSLDAVTGFVAGRTTLPAGAVLVTIDDGCRSTLTGALPILRRHGIPAVAFLPVGMLGAERATTGFGEATMDWTEVRSLVAGGIAIGAHGWSHCSFGALDEAAMRVEAARARAVLEDRLGVPVEAFAYPFGTRRDFTEASARVLREVGYRMAFTSQHGAVTAEADALVLPRIKIESGEGLWMFRLLCGGGLDAWRVVDETLWRLQASPGNAQRGLVP